MKSKAPLKKRNHRRRDREWARAYGSKERVKAVKRMECLVPSCRNRSENAHTESGGTGRKADARTVANVCKAHHTLRDDSMHRLGSAVLFNEVHNVDVFVAAAMIEQLHPTRKVA